MAKASDNEFPSLLIKEGTVPANPAAGDQRLYIDSADHLPKLVNSSGTVATLGPARGKLGYVQVTSSFTTTSLSQTDVTSLTLTVTATARSLKITFFANNVAHSLADTQVNVFLVDTTGPTNVQVATVTSPGVNLGEACCMVAVVTPGAGSKTYKVQADVASAGTASLVATASAPCFLLIEEI